MTLLNNLWILLLESSPWLLLGFLLAGLIKQLIPTSWIEQQLARPGLVSVIKGAVLGAPLPLCSCGVIPAALGVRRAGASKGATAAFMVATPETGVDSISFSLAVLGPVYAIARPLAALCSAIAAGCLVMWFGQENSAEAAPASCGSCCGGKTSVAPPPDLKTRLRAALRYAYVDMVADTGKWLVIGLVLAALINSFVPAAYFLRWGDGVIAMLAMVIIGLPMYICATASTPMAAGFLFAGMSPGAALVFLLTGPATNIATMGVIRAQLGLRALLAYLTGVIGTAILCGLLLNSLFERFQWTLPLGSMSHGNEAHWWRQLTVLLLLGLLANIPWQQWRNSRLRTKASVANGDNRHFVSSGGRPG